MNQSQMTVLMLVRSCLTGEPYTVPDDSDWEEIVGIGRKFHVSVMLSQGIRVSKATITSEIMKLLQLDALQELRIGRSQQEELKAIFTALEAEGVDHLPLKGTTFRYLYPKPEYRYMSDADVLIRPEQYPAIERVMTAMGYSFLADTEHELTWVKNGRLKIEFHKRTVDPRYVGQWKYFGDGFSIASNKDGEHRFVWNAETDMLYAVAHMAKHFALEGGILRNLIDLYYLRRRVTDEDAYRRGLRTMDLEKFADIAQTAVSDWMEGREMTSKSGQLFEMSLSDGLLEERSRQILMAIDRQERGSESKFRTVLRKMFPPLKKMKNQYPTLRRMPFLLPFFWIGRLFGTVLFRRDRIRKNVDASFGSESERKAQAFAEELEEFGLAGLLGGGAPEGQD
ncbi:MAG: nucleotidyltransferase family protein [Lachnospiraceae bacterium]|nr:nucleotidyltransferase family protein [Lachnospiraceae bacterium]